MKPFLSIFFMIVLTVTAFNDGSSITRGTVPISTVSDNPAIADRTSTTPTDSIPTAPPQYRRPEGWKHKGFKWDIPTIAARTSERQMKRAAKEMARVNQVNASGRYQGTPESIDSHSCPEWFVDAKLGIFIDWGPWSIASYAPYVEGQRLYSDWYERRCRPGCENYDYHLKNWGEDFAPDDFMDLFLGKDFDAQELIKVFEAGGARYVVPFLKCHGGYCLWDSSWTYRDSQDRGAKRDFAKELSKACKEHGLKFGFYNSLQGEWDYPVLDDDGSIKMYLDNIGCVDYAPYYEGVSSGKVPVRDIYRECMIPQTIEFIDKYDPDILWYDYDWTVSAKKCGAYDVAAYFYNKNEGRKEVAVNDRYGEVEKDEDSEALQKVRAAGRNWCRTVRGDFYTDEWGDTEELLDPSSWHPWESCSGMSKCYGNNWQETIDMVMGESEFIRYFTNIVARGGNLLLLIGLEPQGGITDRNKERLLQLGSWLKDYGEAIYATRILAPYATDDIDYTQSKDGSLRYAIVRNPGEEAIIRCEVPEGARMTDIKTGKELSYERDGASVRVFIPQQIVESQKPFAIRIK